jgi:hypothetical protein
VSTERTTVTTLRESLEALLAHDTDELYAREEWGSKLNFHDFQEDFERLFGLGKIFFDLPYSLLPDAQLTEINTVVTAASAHLSKIDAFDASTANNPQQNVTQLGTQIKAHADGVTVHMAQWISYLAYQKGDVSKNISNLETVIGKGEEFIELAEGRVAKKEGEIKKIVQQAQDFAGDKGVTIFTKHFDTEAVSNGDEAKKWLTATTVIFSISVVTLAVFMYQLSGVSNWYEWLSHAALIGVLITAGTWCSKNYRILRHQESVNRHKANGLKSFLLFRDAADNDEGTRNTVLLETTRSIFGNPDSGFIPGSQPNSSSEIRVVDATRAAVSASKITRNASE